MSALHRRDWLKQSTLALAGIGLAPSIAFSRERSNLFYADGPIRLSSNENPYGPSPMARKAMADAIASSNRYPWDVTTNLRETIASQYGLTKEHVLMGAGSSEILGLVTQLAALQKGNAITADPTFSIWIPAARKMGLEIISVPLTADKKHDLKSMLSKLNASTRLFYICNPNNPTGTILPAQQIKDAAEEASKQSLVLIDEAYIEYGNEPTQTALVHSNKNIIIAKTFSKIFGLAGARIGYALAHPDTVKELSSLQPWSNAGASAVSLAAAIASLEDKKFLQDSKKWNQEAADFTAKELKGAGLYVIPTSTNFIYYSIGSYKGPWQDDLRAKNILTGRIVEPTGQWTRTTIGTMDEMKQFIKAVNTII